MVGGNWAGDWAPLGLRLRPQRGTLGAGAAPAPSPTTPAAIGSCTPLRDAHRCGNPRRPAPPQRDPTTVTDPAPPTMRYARGVGSFTPHHANDAATLGLRFRPSATNIGSFTPHHMLRTSDPSPPTMRHDDDAATLALRLPTTRHAHGIGSFTPHHVA